MGQLRILAVVGDVGGATELLPALDILAREHKVTTVLDPAGKAGAVLEKAGVAWVAHDPAGGELPFCDVVAVGTSATANGAQVAISRLARAAGIPVVWVEDLYGCGSRIPEGTRVACAPDVFCAIDEAAARIARGTWPHARIAVTGKPSWSHLPAMLARREGIRMAVRQRLGLVHDEVLLTHWQGGMDAEVERQAFDVIRGLRIIPGLRVAFRPHGKLKPDAAREAMIAEAARWEGYVCAGAVHVSPAEELTLASDLVVAGWGGTQGYSAVLAGVPTVVAAFGEAAAAEMRAIGYPDGLPPHVAVGAALLARTPAQLQRRLEEVLSMRDEAAAVVCVHRDPLMPAIDGHAAQKIAAAIVGAVPRSLRR